MFFLHRVPLLICAGSFVLLAGCQPGTTPASAAKEAQMGMDEVIEAVRYGNTSMGMQILEVIPTRWKK